MMEIILSALINDSKAPKWLRYLLVVVVCGLVIFLWVMLALKSPVPAGRVFGTDWPSVDIGKNADDLAALPLPEEAVRGILGETAARLLGL